MSEREQDTYMVVSGYDGRVIAQGLDRESLDRLMAKFVGADCAPPHWKRENRAV